MLKLKTQIALAYKNIKVNYKELIQYSTIYKNYILKIEPNAERVMMLSENNPEYVFAILGTLKAKATTIPVDVMSTAKELKYIMNDCKPEIIFTTTDKVELLKEIVTEIPQYNPTIVTKEEIDTSNLENTPIEEMEMLQDNTTVAIIYTSGTTGSPKGVILSYKNLWYNIDAVVNQVPIMKEDGRMMMILPLHHIFAYAGCLLAPLHAGMTIYIADSLAPEAIIKTLQDGKITVLIGVPRLYEALAKGIMAKINANPISKLVYKTVSLLNSQKISKKIFKTVHDKFGGHLEYLVCGGAALPIETGKVFKNLGLYVLEGYGMTECAPMIAFTRPGERKVGYCGRLLPGVEVKIVETGEIHVKGPNVMTGYYNKPEETALILKDGWLHTGDTAILHPKYGIQITGRIKEIIITSNGKNINPAEIENEITQSSNTIKEAAIVLHNNSLQAIIYPDMNAARANTGVSLHEAVRDEIEKYNINAMSYKRIKKFHITTNELPKTRLGKIKRHLLESLITEKQNTKPDAKDLENRSQTYLTLKEIIDNETNTYAKENDHLEIDLALDSLGRIAIIAFIEERFAVEIKENQLDELSTLKKLETYIENSAQIEINTTTNHREWKEILKQSNKSLKIPKPGVIHWLLSSIIYVMMVIRYRIKGDYNSPTANKPTIFVGNHLSALDGLFITSKLSWKIVRKTLFFAKEKHFNSTPKRFFANNYNIILMDINSNVKESMQQMYDALKNGRNIVIFPEGTRTTDGELNEFKDGFAILAQALKIQIVPVAISGIGQFEMNKSKFLGLFQKIKVDFLNTINPKDDETVKELNNRVYNAIKTALTKK